MSNRRPTNARFVPKSIDRPVNDVNAEKIPRMSDTVYGNSSLTAPWTDYVNLKYFGKGKDSWQTIK